MRKVQFYISGQRIDLFDDESISLTQTIQNIRDVGKVFTDFSKPFTLPASKTNNKIFEHYYNFSIVNGFDARVKVAARIEIDGVPFNTGKIKLEGVDLKNNKPYAYRVTYYGNTVNLKDVLGEDSLSGLSWLSGFSRVYTPTNVRTDLQATGVTLTNDGTSYTDAFCMPLITTNTRPIWDSSLAYVPYFEADGSISDDFRRGNVYYNASEYKGIYYEELKYAIRVYLILKAIEETYDEITFSSDSFFKDTSNPQFYELYMWMHREKGFAFEATDVTNKYTSFPSDSSSMSRVISTPGSLTVFNLSGSQTITYNLSVATAPAADYSITIYRNGSVYQQGSFAGGTSGTALSGLMVNGNYEVYVTGTATQTIALSWIISDPTLSQSNTYVGSSQQLTATPVWNAQQQMPDIKIIDFLTGLFKMFNLTAYVNQAGEIVVKTLDSYYAGGTERNITFFTDIKESSVDPVLPFKEITFEYEGRGTKLAQLYEQEQGKGWGTEEYRLENDIYGETYAISVPFEHMHYDTIPSGHQVGYSLDDNEDAYIGKPVLFYRNLVTTVTPISFLNSNASVSSITSTCSPSNSVALSAATDDDTCHFSVEINEFSSTGNFDGSLFANYYQTYISNVFNSARRLTKIKAQLPVSFLLNYSLADTLYILDRAYYINSITTDLTTGSSELELINIVNAELSAPGNGDGDGEEPGTLTVLVSGQSQPLESTQYTYSATIGGTATGTISYSWQVSNGVINGSSSGATVDVTWNSVLEDSPGWVRCTATRGNLTPVSNQLDVTIQDTAAAFTVEITTGGSTLIPDVTAGDNVTYGIQTTGDTTSVTYNWGIVGGTINSGQGTSSVNVTWGGESTSASIQVSAFRGSTFLDDDIEGIIISAVAPPTFIIDITNVSSPVTETDVVSYGTTTSGTAVGTITYNWTVVGGSFSGQGTSGITVTWNTPGSGSIRVDALREGVGASDQDAITVNALETTATITGDFSNVLEQQSRSYGSVIGGNTSGAISYSWGVSGGVITSGQGTASVDVTWTEPGTGSLSLLAIREGKSGSDSDTLTVLPIYYIFYACDGGTTVIDRLTTPPSVIDQTYIDYSTSPDPTYYTYSGSTQNDSGGYPIVDLQAAVPQDTGCPVAPPPPPSTLTITGDQDINSAGETGVVYALDVDPATVSWSLSDAALSGYNPIDLTITSSTSGTNDTNFTVNFGAYNGNGTETLRSVITATETNPTAPNPASSGSIVISQSAPPVATLNVYARANLVDASRTFSYSTGGSYFTIATATITSGSCALVGTITGLTPGATVTIVTSPTNLLKGNNSSSCPGDFTSPSEGATSYSITVAQGSNDVAFNVDTVAGTYALTIGRSLVDGATACSRYNSGFTGTTYADESSIFASNNLFGDVNGYTYAIAGWYSDGSDFKYWDGTQFTASGTC